MASPRWPRCTARAGPVQGAFVDVSTFEAMTIAFNQFQAVAAQLDGRGPEPEAIGRFVDVPSVEPTADGWVGFATNGSAQFRAFAEMVGHPEWADHPELGRVDRRGEHDRSPAGRDRRVHRHALDRRGRPHRQRAAHPGRAARERRDDARLRTVRGARACSWSTRAATWSSRACPTGWRESEPRPFAPPPLAGADTDAVRGAAAARPAAPTRRATSTRRVRSPGLRVFDFTSYWAGPYAAQILGFLGADVIKVESVQRPDGTRLGTAYSSVGERPWELAPLFHGANTNKRDVTLDFTDPDGLAIARRLLATCDV